MDEGYREYKKVFEDIDKIYQKKLSRFRVTMKGAATNIKNLIDVMLRKSLLKEDYYNYDEGDSMTFSLPEQKTFNDNEAARVIYDRLMATTQALEYQADYMPDSMSEFTEEYLEDCRKILDFFSFHNLSSSNTGINTRTLKLLTDKIINGTDEIFKKVLLDNLKLLSDTFHNIQNTVEDVTRYLKEQYKSIIRFEVFPDLPEQFSEKSFNSNHEEYLKRLEAFMRERKSEIGYNKFWIAEAIKDCYTIDDNESVERVKSMFLSESEKKRVEKVSRSPREKLLNLVYNIVNSRGVVEEIYQGLNYNINLLNNHPRSFIEKIQRVLKTILNIQADDEYFHIEYINPKTKKIQKDTIKTAEFLTSIKKKIAIFNEIAKPNTPLYAKVQKGTNESLLKFIDDSYFNLLLTKERVVGINTEIRLLIPRNLKSKLRNILNSTEQLNLFLNKIGAERRRFIIDQEQFNRDKNGK